jgi:hypothetical protein
MVCFHVAGQVCPECIDNIPYRPFVQDGDYIQFAASYKKTRTTKEQSEQARIDRFCEIVSLIGVDAAETLICAGYKLGV